jgi:hypothetical protein
VHRAPQGFWPFHAGKFFWQQRIMEFTFLFVLFLRFVYAFSHQQPQVEFFSFFLSHSDSRLLPVPRDQFTFHLDI